MIGKFDYNNDEVMNILNNPSYTEEQKKALFEKYKSNLKDLRRKEIISRLNECARNNPIITEEEYVAFLKKYNDDDLSKPFEVIEKELEIFSKKMQDKYDEYLKEKEAKELAEKKALEEASVIEEVSAPSEDVVDDFNSNELADTIFSQSPITEDTIDINKAELEPTVFEEKEVKEVMPEDIPESLNEKGNASAIIISIIAIIIGMVIMYSIIKLK